MINPREPKHRPPLKWWRVKGQPSAWVYGRRVDEREGAVLPDAWAGGYFALVRSGGVWFTRLHGTVHEAKRDVETRTTAEV